MNRPFCPFFGSHIDADSAAAPSDRAICLRLHHFSPIELTHQQEFCLKPAHHDCPVYTNFDTGFDAPRQLPAQTAPLKAPQRIDWSNIAFGFYSVCIAIAMFAVLAWGAALAGVEMPAAFAAIPAASKTPVRPAAKPGLTAQIQNAPQTSPITPFSSPTFSSTIFVAASALSPTGKPAQADSAPPLPTQPAPIAAFTIGAPPPIPCGPPAYWVRTQVRPGDTLFALSQIYHVSVGALQQANCLGSSTVLYAGSVLYVPFTPPTPLATRSSTYAATQTNVPSPTPILVTATAANTNTNPPPTSMQTTIPTPVPPHTATLAPTATVAPSEIPPTQTPPLPPTATIIP